MKNIHILPTDKPSRLSKDENDRIWLSINFEYGINDNNKQNIYITNGEEIKKGDWVYTPNKTIMLVTVKYATESSFMIGNNNNEKSPYYIEFCRKIILTDNKDLIKDGVQSIDDEFLEWFVKNPSCEEVEVTPLRKSSGYYDEKDIWHWDFLAYKIIIPKEEPKHIPYTGKVWEPPKQEILEEASEKCRQFYLQNNMTINQIFEAGAKYQAEKMYSEINVKKSFENKSLKWWMSLTMNEQVEIGLKYNEPTFNLTLRAIIHEFSQFKKK